MAKRYLKLASSVKRKPPHPAGSALLSSADADDCAFFRAYPRRKYRARVSLPGETNCPALAAVYRHRPVLGQPVYVRVFLASRPDDTLARHHNSSDELACMFFELASATTVIQSATNAASHVAIDRWWSERGR